MLPFPRKFRILGLVLALCWGRPAAAQKVQLTIVSARIQAARIKPHQHPGTGGSAPVDPLVRIEIGGRTLETPALAGTLTPAWNHEEVLEPAFIKSVKYIDFILYDHHADGAQMLGGRRLRPQDLLRPGARKFTVFGGSAEVTYAVKLLRAGPAAAPQAGKRGRPQKGAALAAGALDHRAMQQVVDSHSDEVESCAQAHGETPGLAGDVVLLFSISADGSMLGVVVEQAPPVLRKVGECLRQKALRWRFPAPRGSVTARYPVHFGGS